MRIEPSSTQSVHDIWIPPGGLWSLWAKSVLFAQMDRPAERGLLSAPSAAWADGLGPAAIVLDLEGPESVFLGLTLAERGFRPVPAFNACTARGEVVPQGDIQSALDAGAARLRWLPLQASAPPAFLLDARRMQGGEKVRPHAFDNRWRVYLDDFPSAPFLLEHGLRGAVLVQRGSREPQEDVAHILWEWRRAGLDILGVDLAAAEAAPGPLEVKSPAWHRTTSAWTRVLAGVGLRRGPRMGFGHRVPEPSQG